LTIHAAPDYAPRGPSIARSRQDPMAVDGRRVILFKSCYEFLFQGSLLSRSWDINWRTWALPRVKFVVWLACQDRCWMGERLVRRGLQHPPRCPLCDQAEETMRHLLTGCPFSRTVWHEVLSWIRSTAGPPDEEDDFVDWLKSALCSPHALRKGTSSLVMLTTWWI
jgi:hypothetical protein